MNAKEVSELLKDAESWAKENYIYEIQEMELLEQRGVNPDRKGEDPRDGNNSNNSIVGAKLLNGVKKQTARRGGASYLGEIPECGRWLAGTDR